MSIYDTLAPAVDTTNMQAGGIGLADTILGGTAAATISGLGSIYNTFASGANYLGADVATIDTEKTLEGIDGNWANLYRENKSALDAAGFIATSLLPGFAGVKALNLARAGQGTGAVGRALGYAQSQQARHLGAALEELSVQGGSVFTQINKNKLLAMTWGAADQALQAAAFETAVALTMKQSPLLADDSWWDITKTGALNALFGGVIGGGIDALILQSSLKTAVKALDRRAVGYNHLTNLSDTGALAGDKAYAIADSVLALPDSVLEGDKLLGLSFHIGRPDKLPGWNETSKTVGLDISRYLTRTLKATETEGLHKFQTAIADIADGGDIGQLMAGKILTDMKSWRDGSMPPEMIRERLGDYLYGLKKVTPANREAAYGADDLIYLRKSLTPEELTQIKTTDDLGKALWSNTPFKENAYSRPLVFVGTAEQKAAAMNNIARIGGDLDNVNAFPSLRAAWEAGYEIAMQADGTLRVNTRSRLWRKATDEATDTKQFLNLRTGAYTDNAVLTAADRVAAGQIMEVSADSVVIPLPAARPGQAGTKLVLKMGKFDDAADSTYYTARHAWAGKLQDHQVPSSVQINDFSLMDRLKSLPAAQLEKITLLRQDGVELGKASDFSITELANQNKLLEAQSLFSKAYDEGKFWDLREIGHRLNVSQEWLENSIAKKFATNQEVMPSGGQIPELPPEKLALPLESYLQRETVRLEYKVPEQFTDILQTSADMTPQQKRDLVVATVNTNGGQFLTGELAWKYRIKLATEANVNAASSVLGAARHSQLPKLDQSASKLATANGVGATLLGSSNANYGDVLELAMQNSGKLVHIWAKEDVSSMMEVMGPVALALQKNPKAATEVGVVTNLLRSSDEKFIWHPTEKGVMVNAKLRGTPPENMAAATQALQASGVRTRIELQSEDAISFFKSHQQINGDRVSKRQVLMSAKGLTTNYASDVIYAPPIDTTYFKHFAFVRPIEGRAFATSEVAMVFGRDAAELERRIAMVDTKNYAVVTKRGTEDWFKAQNLYDFNLTINEPRINSELRKTGALNDMFPEVRAGNIVEDYLRWHQNQTTRLVRDSVETNYAQQFAELRDLGRSYTEIATSRFAGTSKLSATEVKNPFDDYIKTGLDISKRSEYQFLHQANEFVDALGVRAWQVFDGAFGRAKKGLMDYQQVNQVMEQHGIKGMYQSQEQLFEANVPRDRNLFRETISRANALLANTLLRLDFFNSALNVVSTPLLLSTELASIRTLATRDPELLGKLNDALSIAVPGTGGAQKVPSTAKLLGGAIENFFGKDKDKLIARYMANGDIRSTLAQFHDMLDSIALRPDFKNFSDGVTAAFEKGAKFTLNEQAEQFTRFVSADVMRQLTEPAVQKGVLSLAEQNAFISVFVNRVQGNYITSQRPIAFQGVLGAAVSLFQTYSFNLMQQLARHVGNRDKRAVATMFGMQAGLFGLNGLPFFEAVNTHLIGNASTNPEHRELYSLVPSLLGKEVGDWLMYGSASAMPLVMNGNTPALYSRGDVNPRNLTVLPLNPMDWPFISASTKVVSNLANVGSKLVQGADVSTTLLQGLEHNGLNRPLAGLAQVLAGQSTTSKGSLVSASNDFSLIASASRIAGSRPMDEAVALNQMYRLNAYKTAQQQRLENLGEVVKSHLHRGETVPTETLQGFMKDYARAGGNVSEFNAALQRWSKNANRSVVEDMRGKVNSSYGRRLNEIMGGTPLPDWRNAPAEITQPDAGELGD